MKLKEQNILFISKTMGLGGTENVVLQLCEIFNPLVNKIIVCSCGGINVDRLMKLGIKHYYIPNISDKNFRTAFQVISKIKKIVKQEKITIVHSHHRMAAFYAQFILNKKIVKIANAHNTFYNKKILTKIAYSNTHIIAVGEQVKKNLTDYYKVNGNKIVVIHNAVKELNEKKIDIPQLKKDRENNYTIIGNVGRLTKQKGMRYFIDAASLVFEKNEKTRFYIVGDGEEMESLQKYAKRKLPEGVICFLGYRDDVQNVISQFDFLVLSSLWEGLPLTPIEAFSVGKTVIATAVDGTVEIIKDGVDGYLVRAKDSIQLANKITQLILDPEQRRMMEKNARNTYNTEFSFNKLKERYITFYKDLTVN